MTSSTAVEHDRHAGDTHTFEAETTRLLDLVIHSLYTNREIFLRELISNASDALDRLKFEAMLDPSLTGADHRDEIRLDPDPAARTLTITDTGIGMSRDELIKNLGTIAWSGTRRLKDAAERTPGGADLGSLIGQFGVGFYSAFMVADRVVVVTRRAGEPSATRWESSGQGTFTVADAERATPGTSVTLHLRAADPDAGLDDFTDTWRITRTVKAHSDFVGYPIILKDVHEEFEKDSLGNEIPTGKKTLVVEDRTLNSMKPLWTRPRGEVGDVEYQEFYRQIAHDGGAPLATYTFRAEGTHEYQALLFVPGKAPYDLYYHAPDVGIRLCAKRVVVMEKCQDLLPWYLRFLRGVVDSSDLPLNISRQRLQEDRHIAQIRRWLTKKMLDALEEMHAKDRPTYLRLWHEFGRAIKEGVSSDFDHKDRLVSLLLFESSHHPTDLTSLSDYVGRMKPDQSEIFYLTGASRKALEGSPHVESLRDKGYEILYFVDSVDELLVQYLTEFSDKRLKSVGKGVITLGSEEERAHATAALQEAQARHADLLSALQQRLDAHVKQVRLSTRLTESPACLVVEEHDYSPQMEKFLMKGKGGGLKQRRVLELNPTHDIVTRLQVRFQQNPADDLIGDAAQALFGLSLLAEESELPDPVAFNAAVARMMRQVL